MLYIDGPNDNLLLLQVSTVNASRAEGRQFEIQCSQTNDLEH